MNMPSKSDEIKSVLKRGREDLDTSVNQEKHTNKRLATGKKPTSTSKKASLDTISADIHILTTSIGELTNSVQNLSDQYNSLLVKYETLEGEKATLINEVEIYKSKTIELENSVETLKSEFAAYKQQTVEKPISVQNQDRIGHELNILKQQKIETGIVVRNVSYNQSENLHEMFKCLVQSLHISHEDVIVDDIYRKQSNTTATGPIFANFIDKATKIEFMQLIKKKQLYSFDLGLLTNEKIYISDRLTPENQHLFYKARQLKKQGFKYVWCSSGRIRIRKSDTSQAVTIHSVGDIDKLVNDPDLHTKID